MDSADFINVKKAIVGEYSHGNESFSLDNTENDTIMSLTANTNFKFLDMKKGDLISIEKNVIEAHLNKRLFEFRRKL